MKHVSIAIRIGLRLVPMIRELVEAGRKDSPGGKKITGEELAAILLRHDPVAVVVEEAGVEVG